MWFGLALGFALITSVGLVIAKRIMKEADEYLVVFMSGVLGVPTLLAIILGFYQIPRVDTIFGWSSLAAVAINVVAAFLAYRAIRISDLSLVNPVSAFNPVFTALVSMVILGEIVGFKGWMGIWLVVVGAYLLQVSKVREGWLAPVRAFLTSRGVQLSLVAYFLWAVTPSFQKVAIQHTFPEVPPFASLVGMLGSTLVYFPLVMKFSSKPWFLVKKYWWLFLLGGVLGGIGQTAAFAAFSMASLGPVTAVFKLSMVFSVVMGWLFFGEKGLKERLAGAIVMLLGVVLLGS